MPLALVVLVVLITLAGHLVLLHRCLVLLRVIHTIFILVLAMVVKAAHHRLERLIHGLIRHPLYFTLKELAETLQIVFQQQEHTQVELVTIAAMELAGVQRDLTGMVTTVMVAGQEALEMLDLEEQGGLGMVSLEGTELNGPLLLEEL